MHAWLVCVCAQSGTVNGSDAVEEDDLGNLSCFSPRLCISLSQLGEGGGESETTDPPQRLDKK